MAKNTSNLWENDPSLVPMTPKRAARQQDVLFSYFHEEGVKPEDYVGDATEKAAYKKYVEAHAKA